MSIIGVDAVKDFLELITELVDPYAELNVHGERVYTPVADVLHGRKCAATERNCVGEMIGKILKRRVRVAREVVRNALCNLADREIVALLVDVGHGLLLHVVVLVVLLIRLVQFDAERVLGRGFDLGKEGAGGRPTRVLSALQGLELSTLSLKLSTLSL